MSIRHKISVVLACCLAPAAPAQLSPSPAQASVAVASASSVPGSVLEAFRAYRDVRAVAITLETDANSEGSPARIEVFMDASRRYAQRVILRDSHGALDEASAYFSHFDGERFRARRGTLNMYIEHDASMAWSSPPACAALAPWAVLASLDGLSSATVTRGDAPDAPTSVRIPPDMVLEFAQDGSLRSWQGGRGVTGRVEYSGFSDSSPTIPTTITERHPDPSVAPIVWRVASAEFNPPAERLERGLDFARLGGTFQRFDPDTGTITNPDGSSGGREIQPAAKAVDAWEAKTKTSAWEAVFKWGGIATGLFVLAGVMELIRRRL